jgi:hypothetical protein
MSEFQENEEIYEAEEEEEKAAEPIGVRIFFMLFLFYATKTLDFRTTKGSEIPKKKDTAKAGHCCQTVISTKDNIDIT